MEPNEIKFLHCVEGGTLLMMCRACVEGNAEMPCLKMLQTKRWPQRRENEEGSGKWKKDGERI
eukprot:5566339-Ditylum_brightwellii.AAC.1